MRFILTASLTFSLAANAAGFYLTENGSKALMKGGAFAGEANDMSALQHNPAGLSQLEGFQFLLDGQMLFHDLSFKRYEPGFDPANLPNVPNETATNRAQGFLSPMVGVGYGFKLGSRVLFAGAGLQVPPSMGRYAYPAPNYALQEDGKTFVEDPRKFAPQRYTRIDTNLRILFPTLSLAFAVHPKVLIGVSLQPVFASFEFSQAISSNPVVPKSQVQEDPAWDSVVRVNMPMQYLQFTSIFGALYRPLDWLQFGVSFRPQVMLNARGKLAVELGPNASKAAKVQGDDATLSLKLPAELKVGVHVRPLAKLGVNFDFVYQGWQSVNELVLAPQGVAISTAGGPYKDIAAFRIRKNWQPSYSFRLGADYALFQWLSLYAGGWYETGAVPDEYLGIDFVQLARVTFTGGVGFKVGPIEILAGAAGSPSTSTAVTSSEVKAGNTNFPNNGGVVGAGVYTSSNMMVTLGVRGNFGPTGVKAGLIQ